MNIREEIEFWKNACMQMDAGWVFMFMLGVIFLGIYLIGALTGLYEPSSVYLISGIVFTVMGLIMAAKRREKSEKKP